jgi:hypothetical protein
MHVVIVTLTLFHMQQRRFEKLRSATSAPMRCA